MPEAYSLGRYIPSEFTESVIECGIRALLPSCCSLERISIRVPMGIEPHYDNLQWHQDGGGIAGTVRHMVVWASEMPTEIKSSLGEIFAFRPFDLIYFDNDKAFHRQPVNTRPHDRWFVSVRCSGAI